MLGQDGDHESIKPFGELDPFDRELDTVNPSRASR
jgi:hypothetical protein